MVSQITKRLTFWRTHCAVNLVEVVEAALAEIGVALLAVFAPAAIGVHGVLKVHNHFKAVVVQARDGFVRHQQVFFRRGFQRLHHIQQLDLTTTTATGTRSLVPTMNCTSGQSCTLVPRPRVLPNSASFIAPCRPMQERRSDRRQTGSRRQSQSPHSERQSRHALQQADSVGYGDVDVRLLHPVAKTGIEQLDFSGFVSFMCPLFLRRGLTVAVEGVIPLSEKECVRRTG